jgi:hypothetical protein
MKRRDFLSMLGALGLGATLVKFEGITEIANEALASQSHDLDHTNDIFIYARATEDIPAYSACWIDDGRALLMDCDNFKPGYIASASVEGVNRGESAFFNTGNGEILMAKSYVKEKK